MVLGEHRASRHRCHPDRCFVHLRELLENRACILAANASARDDDRRAGLVHRIGRPRDQCRIGDRAAADLRRRNRRAGSVPVVDWHGDEHGAARCLHGHVVGAQDGERHVLGTGRFVRVHLTKGCGNSRRPLGVEERVVGENAARLLACGDDQRRLVAKGGEDVAERMAGAGRRMEVHEGGTAAHLGETVRHADDHTLLQAQDVLEVLRHVAEQRQLGRAGVSEQRGHAEIAQQRHDGIAHGRPFRAGEFFDIEAARGHGLGLFFGAIQHEAALSQRITYAKTLVGEFRCAALSAAARLRPTKRRGDEDADERDEGCAGRVQRR